MGGNKIKTQFRNEFMMKKDERKPNLHKNAIQKN